MTFHFAEIALCSNTKRCDICHVLINAGSRQLFFYNSCT
jgi:hypothetical protein